MSKYLEKNGLRYLCQKIKNRFEGLEQRKMDEPETDGPFGYVLMSDGNGGRGWGKITEDTQTSFSVVNKSLNITTSVSGGISFSVSGKTLTIDT